MTGTINTDYSFTAASIANIFDQAQKDPSTHRRHCATLRKLQTRAYQTSDGERAFNDAYLTMITRILCSTGFKSSQLLQVFAERSVRFVNEYFKYIAVQPEGLGPGFNSKTRSSTHIKNASEMLRLVSTVVSYLTPGCQASKSTIRMQVLLLISEALLYVPSPLEMTTYHSLTEQLKSRLSDRESGIRQQAVIAIKRLHDVNGLSDDDKDKLLQAIMDSAAHDPEPDVRKAALENLPVKTSTLLAFSSYVKDSSSSLRLFLMSKVLTSQQKLPRLDDALVSDIIHLSLNGLDDPDTNVSSEADKLLQNLFHSIRSEDGQAHFFDSLSRFAQFLLSSSKDTDSCVKTIRSILASSSPEDLQRIRFPDTSKFWITVPYPSALLYRILIEDFAAQDGTDILDFAELPSASAFSDYIRKYCNGLLGDESFALNDHESEQARELLDSAARKNDPQALVQLLQLCQKLDYGDELGRRRMFSTLTDVLSNARLPEEMVEHVLRLLQVVMSNERDFIRVVVEIIIDMRDNDAICCAIGTVYGSQSSDTTKSSVTREKSLRHAKDREQMSPEEREEADNQDLRSFAIVIPLLRIICGPLKENSILDGILADLIIPCMKRTEVEFRERGMEALCLMSLISTELASSSLNLLFNQFHAIGTSESLKRTIVQTLFDLVCVDDAALFRQDGQYDRICTFIVTSITTETSKDLQKVLVLGACKLLLWELVESETLVQCLMRLFLGGSRFQERCLRYFFYHYCRKRVECCHSVQSAFLRTLEDSLEALDTKESFAELQTRAVVVLSWLTPSREEDPVHSASQKNQLLLGLLRIVKNSAATKEQKTVLKRMLEKVEIQLPVDAEMREELRMLMEDCSQSNSSLKKHFKQIGKVLKN